jgi:teichoic acid D-alanine hydrolase
MLKTISFLLLIILQSGIKSDQVKLQYILLEAKEKENFNGVVLVATGDKVDLLEVINQPNLGKLKVDARFRVASFSKMFTAVLTMKLLEQGKLKLDGTISSYLPDYQGEGKDKVTIHHLLTYASGIVNQLEPLGMTAYQTKSSLDDFIKKYCSGKLVKTPGTESNYANTEYIILHKIIEKVSGKSFEKLLKEQIIKPLNLKNTGLITEKTNNIQDGLLFNDSLKAYTQEEAYFASNFFGSGGMFSSVEDMFKFSQAIFSQKILKPETNDIMLKINEDLGYTAYGLWGSTGWGSFAEPFYYRTGGIQGSTSNWIRTINNQKTVIVLSNTNATNLYGLSEKLYLASLGTRQQ